MNVMVTGGAGYIGSHAVRLLLDSGHSVVVVDDLLNGHREAIDGRARFYLCQVGAVEKITDYLIQHKVEAVLHFAGSIDVAESMQKPELYYENNFIQTLNLLNAMNWAKVRKLVFSSTAAVYGEEEKVSSALIEESDPTCPVNPYGRSKLMTEWAIKDFVRAHHFSAVIFRYFNVAGAHPSGQIGEEHTPEHHLIPRLLECHLRGKTFFVYGEDYPTADGTCVRDFVHVMDLCEAHVDALKAFKPHELEIYNLGSSKGYSVREVLRATEKVTGKLIQVRTHTRRPGDPASLIACSQKARKKLPWKPKRESLEQMISDGYRFMLNKANLLQKGVKA